ncbi:hypothetical protein ACEPAI_1412 [Sanghuangporus weigelae]
MSIVDDTPRDAPFFWGWKNGMNETSLMECGSYEISVVSQPGSTSFGVPPYYLMAWKADGVPTVSSIGSDRSSLSWQVNQASGSTLVLTVVDSRGLDGGIDPYIYTVTDNNTTTNCLPTSPSTSITLAANVSTSEYLETCEPLEVRISGGQKPYTVSIAVLDSMMVTNMTLNGNDDVLTWPNQAGPNKQLLVSVSDANGVWGKSTGIYSTAGANTTDCSIRTTSRPSGSTDSDKDPQASQSNQGGTHDSGFASQPWHYIAIIVPIAIIGILVGLVFFLRRRRRQRGGLNEPQPAILPDAWVGPSSLLDRDLGTSRKTYLRVSPSDDILPEPKDVVQHEDAADARELPPPYRDRTALVNDSTDSR